MEVLPYTISLEAKIAHERLRLNLIEALRMFTKDRGLSFHDLSDCLGVDEHDLNRMLWSDLTTVQLIAAIVDVAGGELYPIIRSK